MIVRNKFHRIQFSECLLLLESPDAAAQELSAVPEPERDPFWHQRQAQALLQTNAAASALQHIDLALQDQRQAKYHSAFLHDRFLIRLALGEKDAITDLEAAIDACAPGRYKSELEAKLATVRSQPMRH